MPSGAPPGSTIVSAVDACVNPSAPSHESCGRYSSTAEPLRDVERGGDGERRAHGADSREPLPDTPVARDAGDDLDE